MKMSDQDGPLTPDLRTSHLAESNLPDSILDVLIVSDVLLFREGISAKISQSAGLKICAVVSPAQALEKLARQNVDIIVLDASRRRALVHVTDMRSIRSDIPIVAFGIGGHQDALAGAEAGVFAFVGEDGTVEDIHNAVRMAARGESYCSPRLTACLITHIASIAGQKPMTSSSRLTGREREVAFMVGDGLSNKEIAGALRISPATVKNHVHNILDKLDLPSRSAIGSRIEATGRA